MADTPVTLDRSGDVSVVHFDDGKANALSPAAVAALHAAVDDTADAPGALVLAGRPGRFSAGFDLSVMTSGPEPARDLLRSGTHLLLALYSHPRPVVIASTGHAIAGGALLLLCGDLRIGVDADVKIGLNEHAIGMPLPTFGVELARDRLSVRHFTRATALAEIYDASGALDAGWLDELATDPVATAIERAAALTEALDMDAFASTRRRTRGALVARVAAGLDEDLADISIDTGDR